MLSLNGGRRLPGSGGLPRTNTNGSMNMKNRNVARQDLLASDVIMNDISLILSIGLSVRVSLIRLEVILCRWIGIRLGTAVANLVHVVPIENRIIS